jgi:mannose-1-phosphate guanylyltransferase
MVLAAGRGERMRPLSDAVPKPALPLVEEPVVASPLRLAATSGARRLVANTWHLADAMEAAVASVRLPTEAAISREPELMGTAGGLALARDRGLLGDRGSILVVNGDGLVNVELDPLVRRFTRADDLVTLALLPHLDPKRWSRVLLDAGGRVRRISRPGSPDSGEVPLLYPGVMLVSRSALDGLEAGPGAIPERLWRPALAAGRLGGVVVSGYWREIGTPDDYLGAALDRLSGRTVVDRTATVDPTASIAIALVGERATIDEQATVRQSVVAAGARIERGARVVRSVLLGGVSARAGDRVTDSYRAAPEPRIQPRG